MKPVKLTVPLLIEDAHRDAGDVVLLSDERAAELVKLGHAEHADGDRVANPGTNPLMDAIHPEPPEGIVPNPADSTAPNVEDNPGLKQLAAATRARSRAARVKPGDEPGKVADPASEDPDATANELEPRAVARPRPKVETASLGRPPEDASRATGQAE